MDDDMTLSNHTVYPERLAQAFIAKAQLADEQIYFAPIRHHSPACAYALQHYIAELKPSHILIEAPAYFNDLIGDILSEQTHPPVAIFAQAHQSKKSAKDTQEDALPLIRSAYFPFCEYSPEWVALQRGQALGATLQFIDLDWAAHCQFEAQLDHPSTQQTNLMAERYLAHSQYIQTLAQSLYCRDHQELWDHLFELQTPDQLKQPTQFFDDVFAWCALARLDYEQDVLYRDGSLHREYCMYQHIAKLRGAKNKILVVTGGFHTLALIEQLSSKQVTPYLVTETAEKWQQQAWLIRYSFDRLDALNGYASGMPSPAYYQRLWQDLNAADLDVNQQFYTYLNEICHVLSDQQALEITPYIALRNTAEIAQGLAQLRGHYRPSRYDLLDALQSSLVKGEMDDGQHYLWRCIYEYLSGQALGQVAKNQRTPALLQNTYQKIAAFRFKLDDTLSKQRKLDIYRKPLHQKISQFLHLLEFLQVGFASRSSGPDFVQGAGMDLLFEEWSYAWTPSVEARLLELSEQGDQLSALAAQKLLKEQQNLQLQGISNSAMNTARLFAQACRLGLYQQLSVFEHQLQDYLYSDQNLASLIGAAQQLFYLWHGRHLFQLPADHLVNTLSLAIRQACYALPQILDTHEDKLESNVQHLIALHELIKNTQNMLKQSQIQQNDQDDIFTLFYQQLDLHEIDTLALHRLKGAVHTLLYLDEYMSQTELQQHIQSSFAAGSYAEDAVQYLQGLLSVAPEIFVQSDLAIQTLYTLIEQWSDTTFIQILPDLRYMFSQLNPKQSQRISTQIAHYTGLQPDQAFDQVYTQVAEQDMLRGAQLNHHLKQMLAQDSLSIWLHAAKSDQEHSEQQSKESLS